MRLTEHERRAIVERIGAFTERMSARLYLYGSRIDDNAKGGDIDLLLLVDAADCEELAMKKYKILASIKAAIGERRIDLTIAAEGSDDPFIATILPTAVTLSSS